MMRGIPVGGIAVGVVLWLALPSGEARADTIQAAIDRGVNYLKQNQVVHQGEARIGANALAGLTLLECGVQPPTRPSSA